MIETSQYRIAIGVFVGVLRGNRKSLCSKLFFWQFIYMNVMFVHIVGPNLLHICGDIEINPCPNEAHQTEKSIKFLHVNVRSILADGDTTQGITKLDEFKTFVYSHDFDVIGLSETWLDDCDTIDSDKLLLTGYLPPIRKDRSRHGGGVCAYIRDEFAARQMSLSRLAVNIEAICIEYQVNGAKNLLCITYKLPDTDTLDYLDGIDSLLSISAYNDIHLMGDFNCKHDLFCPTDRTTTDGRLLKAFFDAREFAQVVHEPTRFQQNYASCLDLVFTNRPTKIDNVTVHPQINNCDHCPVSVTLSTTVPGQRSYKRMVWDY